MIVQDILDHSKCKAHLNVPHSKYGSCTYLLPLNISTWLHNNNWKYYYTGSTSSGDGYTNGINNTKYSYHIVGDKEESLTIFKILFPDVGIYVFDTPH